MKYIFSLFILFYSYMAYSQPAPLDLPKVIGPSPSVAAVQKYGDLKVSKHTGVPSINIPLYTINLKDLSIPISISYNASGIKVNEESSRIGLGWSLDAGGTISRNILGLDDLRPRSMASNSFDLVGFPYKNCVAQLTLPFGGFTYNIEDKIGLTDDPGLPGIAVDLEPDLFYFNFLGNSGKFLLRKKDTTAVFEDPSCNIKIKLLLGAQPKLIAIGSDGTIYNFDQFEVCSTYGQDVPDKITAWYLTQITTTKGTIVHFSYLQNNTGLTVGLNDMSTSVNVNYAGQEQSAITQKMVPRRSYNNVLLNKIEFAGGSVSFSYADRLDIQGDKRLTSMIVNTDNGNIIKKINLIQDYFVANSSTNNKTDASFALWGSVLNTDWLNKRLKLSAVEELSADNQNKQVHQFFYNETILPMKNSTSKDHWGYFNNADNGDNLIPDITWAYPGLKRIAAPPQYICTPSNSNDFSNSNELYSPVANKYYVHYKGANKEVNPDYSQAFLMNRIIYPTGGSTELTFEQNTYDRKKSFVNDTIAFAYDYVQSEKQLAFMAGVYNIPTSTVGTYPFTINQSDVLGSEGVALVNLKFSALKTGTNTATNSISTQVRLKKADGTLLDQLYFNSFDGFTNEGANIYSISFLEKRLPAGDYKIEIALGGNIVDKNCTFYYVTGKWFSNAGFNPDADGVKYQYAGGLRVKNISSYTAPGSLASSIDYQYHYKADNNHNGVDEVYSTGKLMERPHYFNVQMQNTVDKVSLTSDGNCRAIVGYDSVITIQDHIKTKEEFYNEPYRATYYQMYYTELGSEMMPGYLGFPTVTMNGAGLPGNLLYLDVYFDNKLSGLKDFYDNGNGKLVRSTNYLYHGSSEQYSVLNEAEYKYTGTGNGMQGIVWADRLYWNINKLPWFCALGLPPVYSVVNFFYPTLRSSSVQLSQTIERNFQDNISLTTTTDYTYNQEYLLQSKKVSNSKGEVIASTYTYPNDYSMVNSGWLQKMKDANMLALPIETRTSNNNLTTSALFNEYSVVNDKTVLGKIYKLETDKPVFINPTVPSAILDNKFKLQAELNYNLDGNIRELQKANDVKEVYLWGYNSTYPVAKVVGIDYATAAGSINQNILDTPSTDDALRAELNKLRSIPGALVTTYTYKPLVGMTSATDPSGKTVFYEYDSFQRLKLIRDQEGKIVKQFDYKYQGQ